MTNNPFEVLEARLSSIESLLLNLQKPAPPATVVQSAEDYLHIEKVYQDYNIPVPTVRRHKKSIGYIRFGRRLMFRRSDVLRWLEANEYRSRASIQQAAIDRMKNKAR